MNKVPSLRFKEFSGEWEEKRLGEVSEIIMGQSPSSSEYNEEFKGLPLIQGNADCKNRKIYPRMYTTEITKESFPNDIIMTVRAPVGAISFSDIHSCIGRGVCAIRNANKFIYHYLIKLEDSWDKLAQGSTFTAVNSNDIKNLAVKFPCLKEQEKIGNFLSSVDKKISIVEEKLNLFNQYKKGIMQKIFNQELRFKDENGNNYPEWEEKKLGDLITSQGGRALEKYSNESGKYKFISIGNYSENSKFLDNGKRIDLNSETEKQLLNKNELVMILNDKTKTGNIIGRTLLIDENNMYIYNQRSQRIVCKKEFLPKFAYVLLNSSYRNNIVQNAQGGTQIYINFSTVENLILNLPCLEEQKKIADFLFAIDDKIENISGNLESLKLFKKSMLQKMFV